MDQFAEEKRADIERRVERFRLLFEQTANPLYTWRAICYLLAFDQQLPGWCLNYIKYAAIGISNLVDEASAHEISGKTIGYEMRDTIHAGATKKQREARANYAAVAAKVPRALLIVSERNRNAFKELVDHNELIEDAALMDWPDFGHPDEPKQIAAGEMIASRNSVEPRSVNLRVRKGRNLLNPTKAQ